MIEEQVMPKTQYSELITDGDKILWLTKYNQWQQLGLTESDPHIKQMAYQRLGFPEEAKRDKEWVIRIKAYEALGFTEEALKDEYSYIRIRAYEALGWTEEAFKDEHENVRRAAYDYLGYTEEALCDPSPKVHWRAKIYFEL